MITDRSVTARPETDLVIETLSESTAARASVCYCIADYATGFGPDGG